MSSKKSAQHPLSSIPRILSSRRAAMPFLKLDPRQLMRNPGDLRHRSGRGPRDASVRARHLVPANGDAWFSGQIAALALVHGAVRNLRRSRRRRTRQGAGRQPCAAREADTLAKRCSIRTTRDDLRERAGARPAGRRCRARRGRRTHPRRRRGRRRRRVGQRKRDHRRVRAGHPRIRRRPLGRHRRHDGALRLDQGAHHRRAGLELRRPDDRADRRRRAAEDAERDCAVDPAVRPDADLPDRRRDALGTGRLFRNAF